MIKLEISETHWRDSATGLRGGSDTPPTKPEMLLDE
jgi:hypothetical protein